MHLFVLIIQYRYRYEGAQPEAGPGKYHSCW
jgi:hypothetical protein